MQIQEPFIQISVPQSNAQISPSRNQPPQTKFDQLKSLPQIRIGNYLVKAQRISNGSIDGYTAVFDDKGNLLFQGEYARSKKNGFGIEYTAAGSMAFQGNFRDDKYDGWGRTAVYSGEFRDGFYDGYGLYSTNTVYYQGFFTRGLYNGQGVHFQGEKMTSFHPVKNINSFLTEALKSDLKIMDRYSIEEIYLGEWKEGNKHGFGRLWKHEYWYAGQFSNNLPHGFGAEEDRKSKKVHQTKYKLGNKAE